MTQRTAKKYKDKGVFRNKELEPVKLGLLRVEPEAQRDFRQPHADDILADFDLNQIGTLEVSFRNGHYYITDGQHRFDVLKRWLGDGWQEQYIECWVARDTTLQEDADAFLRLNNRRAVTSFDKFRIAVTAERPDECAVNAIILSLGLKVAQGGGPTSVGCVTTLLRLYKREGGVILKTALETAWQAFGDAGLDALVIDGLGRFFSRYGIEHSAAIAKALARTPGGATGLFQKAEALKLRTGHAKAACFAAACVEAVNRGRNGKKLPSWWAEAA